MLSQKGKYAIRAVLYLAVESSPENGLKGGKAVSEALKMPLAFTSKILQQLAKSNIISSNKGPGGGFYISQENGNLPIMAIVEATDDLNFFNQCGLGLSNCSEERPCPIHNVFKESREKLLQLFYQKTIRDLKQEINQSDLFLVH